VTQRKVKIPFMCVYSEKKKKGNSKAPSQKDKTADSEESSKKLHHKVIVYKSEFKSNCTEHWTVWS